LKDETRKKISAALSKRVVLEKTRKKLSDANKGRRLSESHKKSLSYSRSRKISAFGKTLTIQEWSQENGIPVSTISKRISYGWEISDAVSRKRRNYNASPRGFE
jgi:Fic family protein